MAFHFRKIIFGLLILSTACSKQGGDAPIPVPVPTGPGRVLVVCEGSLGLGNSALTVLPGDSTERVIEDAFQSANGQLLGDIFQSITRIGPDWALCINNSDRVLLVDGKTFQLKSSVTIPKPRYLLPVAPGKAYVSTLFSNRIYVLNTASFTVLQTIELPAQNPEGMILHNDQVLVACWDTACSQLYQIDPTEDRITGQKVLPAHAPQEIIKDAAGKLWVLSGNDPKGVPSTFTVLNGNDFSVEKRFSFAAGKEVLKPVFNAASDTLYWLSIDYYNTGPGQSGVFRMPVAAQSLPQTAFVSSGNLQYFWGLCIQPATGNIFVADPKGFTQRGEALVYTPAGNLLRRYPTGVGPGRFYFE
jgi:DNA-binding beta-propeller fold protein YncE